MGSCVGGGKVIVGYFALGQMCFYSQTAVVPISACDAKKGRAAV